MQLSRGSTKEQPSMAVGRVAGDDFSCATARNDGPFCVPSNVNTAPVKSKNAITIRLLIIASWLNLELKTYHPLSGLNYCLRAYAYIATPSASPTFTGYLPGAGT